jgi:hypothetical protein
MRSPRASTGRNSGLFLCTSCSPRHDQAEEERVSRSEIGAHVYE